MYYNKYIYIYNLEYKLITIFPNLLNKNNWNILLKIT
jgi:hypothetical protein